MLHFCRYHSSLREISILLRSSSKIFDSFANAGAVVSLILHAGSSKTSRAGLLESYWVIASQSTSLQSLNFTYLVSDVIDARSDCWISPSIMIC